MSFIWRRYSKSRIAFARFASGVWLEMSVLCAGEGSWAVYIRMRAFDVICFAYFYAFLSKTLQLFGNNSRADLKVPLRFIDAKAQAEDTHHNGVR